MAARKVHTLYLCYFGLREPLVQTQVLPYLRELAAGGFKISLLTFEPEPAAHWDEDSISAMRARLQAEGVNWYLLPYHKRPSLPATLYDIWNGARFARRLARRERLQVMHARAHIAAAMGALAKWRLGGNVKLIFDIRGFLPEEYTDAGLWPRNGWLYRGVKAVERRLLATADAFVVLTHKSRAILFPGCAEADQQGRPIEMIPCCVDWQRFRAAEASGREEARRALKLTDRRVLIYVGSFGGWYLTDEMMDFCVEAHRRDARTFTLILTQRDIEQARQQLLAHGIAEADCLVTQAAPADVPRYLAAADAALSFIKPCYSKQSSSPTKIAEYLAGGLPVVGNAGIGDLDELLTGERIGVLVREFTPAAYERALDELDELSEEPELRARCQTVARREFDLQSVGGPRYRRLYARLLREPNALAALPDGLPDNGPQPAVKVARS